MQAVENFVTNNPVLSVVLAAPIVLSILNPGPSGII